MAVIGYISTYVGMSAVPMLELFIRSHSTYTSSTRVISRTHFLFLQGAHDSGTLFLFLTILYCPSGDCGRPTDVEADGGVGDIWALALGISVTM